MIDSHSYLSHPAPPHTIQLLVLDVDGVCTDGRFWSDGQSVAQQFHVHDGWGMKQLQAAGIPIAIISSRHTKAVSKRMAELGIQHVFQGESDKLSTLSTLADQLSIPLNHIAYVGDDRPDEPPMQAVGLPIAVANAVCAIKDIAFLTTHTAGGAGAVREVCEYLLHHHHTENL